MNQSFQLIRTLSCAAIATVFAYGIVAAESAPKEARETLPQLLERAGEAAAKGDHRASVIYKKATLDNPDSAEAWTAFGEHLRFYVHDAKAAAEAFEKALASRNQDPNAAAFAWRGLGELASKDLKDELAVQYFKKSLLALPLADTHRSLCHLYCRQRNFSAAAEQARAAVKLNASDPIALLLCAAQLHRAGKSIEARQQYEQALSLSGMNAHDKAGAPTPVHCCVIYNAAGYLAVCGEDEAALTMLKRFLETPNHRHLSRTEIECDADFEALKKKPEFQILLNSLTPDVAPLK